ncbi:MAG: DsbA family protein [Minisyncoccia bacterium]
MKKINWTVIIIVIVLLASFIGYGKSVLKQKTNVQNDDCQGKTLQNTTIKDVEPLGNTTSTNILEIYSDYQCPFCARYYVETIKPFIKDYVDTGKIKLIYHDIAFEGERSQWAAEAGRCANDQGKFWEYHDKIMSTRYETNNTQVYDKNNLVQVAKDLGLDECEFTLCLNSGKYTKTIQDETQAALNKIKGTPTSFLNGQILANSKGESLGAMNYEALQTQINKIITQ